MANNAFVLLDRDGVINQDSDQFIKKPEEWIPLPGSLEAIALLNEHGYKIVVISNQSGLARGLFKQQTLAEIHAKMQALVEQKGGQIEAIYVCPHGPDSTCDCRKPKPGLLWQFSQDYKFTLKNIPFIGDSLRDIQAGFAVHAAPILVETGKGRMTRIENPNLNIPTFENLYAAARFIVSRH